MKLSGTYRKKLYTLGFHLRPIQRELVDAAQYDRNFEKFADALFDLLGEESSEVQFAKQEEARD